MEIPPPPEKSFVTIKAFIKKGSKMLLQEEQGPKRIYWDLPGGRLDPGEDIVAALKREVKEEIGVEIILPSELPMMCYSTIGGEDGVVALVFAADLASEDFVYTNEVLHAKFLTQEEVEAKSDLLSTCHGDYIKQLANLL